MGGEDCNNGNEHETDILFLSRKDYWIVTLLNYLGTDEIH